MTWAPGGEIALRVDQREHDLFDLRSHAVGANKVAGHLVFDTLDLRIGHGRPQKRELAGARRSVASRDVENGAVVLDDQPGSILREHTLRKIAILFQDPGQLADAIRK